MVRPKRSQNYENASSLSQGKDQTTIKAKNYIASVTIDDKLVILGLGKSAKNGKSTGFDPVKFQPFHVFYWEISVKERLFSKIP